MGFNMSKKAKQPPKTANGSSQNPPHPPKTGKSMGFKLGVGAFALCFLLACFWVIAQAKKSKPSEQAPQVQEVDQETQVIEQEQTDSENEIKAVSSHGLDSPLINYIDEKQKQSSNYWAIEKINANGTVDNPFEVLARQALQASLQATAFYSSNPTGVKALDGQTIIALDGSNEQATAIYDMAVNALLNTINSKYDYDIKEVLINDGANMAKVATVIPKDTQVQISSLQDFQNFENWVLSQAGITVTQMIDRLQATVVIERKEQETTKEDHTQADNDRMKAIIDTLNSNLEQARRDNENKAMKINELQEKARQTDKNMAQFLSRLESNPKINDKLNYSTLAKQAPHLTTQAVIGDRIFLQDSNGTVYNAKVGDIIQLENGKRLILSDVNTQQVVIE